MKLLLDTHVALWWWVNASELSSSAKKAALSHSGNTVYFSAVSGYEIFQKIRIGKLSLPDALLHDLLSQVRQEAWDILPLGLTESIQTAGIEHRHRYPFDRLLAAQCKMNGLTLVTRDAFLTNLASRPTGSTLRLRRQPAESCPSSNAPHSTRSRLPKTAGRHFIWSMAGWKSTTPVSNGSRRTA